MEAWRSSESGQIASKAELWPIIILVSRKGVILIELRVVLTPVSHYQWNFGLVVGS
jgi:hypothetical protein